MRSTRQEECTPPPGNHWVLGAGGWNLFHHLGVLKAADELGVEVDSVIGASAGSLVAAFITNGYKAEDLVSVFLEMRALRWNPASWLSCLRGADPLSLAVGGWFSLEPFMRQLVARYKLKPNSRLRILTCDLLRHEPVVFEGTDYDLARALAASGAVPGVFQPLWQMKNGRLMLLVDGAVYHYNPTEFNCGQAIVSKFRPATDLPGDWETPADLYFHMRELYFPLAGNQRYVDDNKHIVIETGMPDVAGLNFGISRQTCLKMVENGYSTAKPVLAKAIADGRVTASKGTRRRS